MTDNRPTINLTTFISFTLLLFVLLFTASSARARPVEVTDFSGRRVTLDKPAQRIIALSPHLVENVFSAGAGGKLVGVVSYSNYPSRAKTIPIVGSYRAYSLEKIVALHPDLVLTWDNGDGRDSAKPFETLGIPVYVDDPHKLRDVATSVRDIGILSGTPTKAGAAADRFLQRLATLRTHYQNAEPVSVFYQVWNQPLQTVNGTHIISAVIHLCGGRNIFADTPVIAPKISLEAVLERNPDAIIASGMDKERPEWLDQWRDYPQLNAVINDNLYFIPPDFIQRHTFRILKGAEMMCRSLQEVREKRGRSPEN